MKRAREIFSRGEIDAGFAADRTVDHREQRRWHLEKIDAAQIARRGKSADVADHAAANREERAVAIEFLRREKIEHAPEPRERLRPLARLDREHRRIAEHRAQPARVLACEIRVGQHRDLAPGGREPRDLAAHVLGQIRAEANRIAARTEVDVEGLDHASHKTRPGAARRGEVRGCPGRISPVQNLPDATGQKPHGRDATPAEPRLITFFHTSFVTFCIAVWAFLPFACASIY